MKFDAVLKSGKKTATGIEVPASVVEALGAGKKPPVAVTVNGYRYRTTIASMGGRFMIPFSADHRRDSGLAAGDALAVEIEIDNEVREILLAEDFAAALQAQPAAAAAFAALSYSRQRWFALNVEGAKTAETRSRRIANAVAALLGSGTETAGGT